MDASLIREHQAFKRRAAATPAVENIKKAKAAEAKKKAAMGAMSQSQKQKAELAKQRQATTASGTSGFRTQAQFACLAKIVRHMKTRHMDDMDHPLTLEEILDETNQTDLPQKIKTWLGGEALKNNPKISFNAAENTYVYNPPYRIKNKKGLIKLLKQHDLHGLGGIFLEDVQESLPKCDKVVRILKEDSKIIEVNRTVDKKKILFHHDHNSDLKVDEEFVKLWRSVAVDSCDDHKIDEYLEKQGIKSMQDLGVKKSAMPKQKRKPIRRKNKGPKDNDHLSGVLQNYDEFTASKGDK